MRLVSLVTAAALVVTVSACATPSAEKSTAEGRAGAIGKVSGKETKRDNIWGRLSKYIRPGEEPRRPGDLPPGKPGLFSGKDGEIVLFSKVESNPADSTKPSKVRR